MTAFKFSRYGLSGKERVLERIGEILPGAASWTILLGMIALAVWKPLAAAVIIIAFDLYWLLRLAYMTLFLVVSYVRLSMERHTDWLSKARGLNAKSPRLEDIYHLVIFPIIKEPREVYEASVRSLLEQTFPPARILVILAVEDRAPASVKAEARAVQERYHQQFLACLLVVHPDGVPGEARVKGANVTHAAKAAAAYFAQHGIAHANVVVSCFDADTVVSPQYVACLTYHFLACPTRARASFQPIPVYHNNIWQVPGFARMLDVGSSFFQLVEATNPEKLVTFSSHSMSFEALVDIGYWPVDMISDDSAIFWKAFLYYDGDYQVVPMYVTVSMDVAAADSWRRTVLNVYKQKRRWAWGVENFPIVMRGFLRASAIPWTKKLAHTVKLFEGHLAWATWPFLLGIIGWIPAIYAGREFSNSVVYYTAPRISMTIFQLSSIGLITTIVLSFLLLPRPAVKRPWLKQVGHLLEWCLIPVVAIVFSAIPALEAQTRLMLGRYMEFWVTEKRR